MYTSSAAVFSSVFIGRPSLCPVLSRACADYTISKYPIVAEGITLPCVSAWYPSAGVKRAALSLPTTQDANGRLCGYETHSTPRSLTFPAPFEWKRRAYTGNFRPSINHWTRPVAGTDWAPWKKYNPLWALRGNRNYRASDLVKRESGSRRTEWSSSLS